MEKVNPATEYVLTSKQKSPVHEFVADHGQPVENSEIDHTTVAGHTIAVSTELTADERDLVATAIQAVQPAAKECFANAIEMWQHDDRFKYAEGFGVDTSLDVGGIEHAWSMLDNEKLVDATVAFDHYHGVVFDDSIILQEYPERQIPERGIIGNHKNRFEFLRKRGYFD